MASHGNSVNNTKAIKTKEFLRNLRCICILYQNFISVEVAVQKLGGGHSAPHPGTRCGSKRLWGK